MQRNLFDVNQRNWRRFWLKLVPDYFEDNWENRDSVGSYSIYDICCPFRLFPKDEQQATKIYARTRLRVPIFHDLVEGEKEVEEKEEFDFVEVEEKEELDFVVAESVPLGL